MKKLFTIVLAACLLCVSAAAAENIDMNYVGLLNTYSGTPASSGGETGSELYLTDRISYERESGEFCYHVDGVPQAITADVMTGMVTTGDVSITVPNGLAAVLYRNGNADDQPLDAVSEAGSYVLTMDTPDGNNTQVLDFVIVNGTSGALSMYRMPQGFRVTELRIDGAESDFDTGAVDMTEEGRYEIEYQCMRSGVTYHLDVNVDHTPPTLELIGTEEGVARGPVEITGLEEGADLRIYMDGSEIAAATRLTKPGHYELIASDAAGNSARYELMIMLYFNASSILFILVVLAALAALTIYLIRYRTRMRVR